MMWLALSAAPAADDAGNGLEQMLPRLASIARFADELDTRLAADGLGGLVPARELHRRVVDLLTALAPDVGRATATVADVVAALRGVAATLDAIRRIKSELARVA